MSASHDYAVAAVLGVVFRGHDVLLVKRSREPDKGKWGLPGGKIECGEDMRDALERELREETGIEVSAGPVVDVFDVVTRDATGEHVLFHYVIVVMLCRDLNSSAQERAGDDAQDAEWFPMKGLLEADNRFSDRVTELVIKARATNSVGP